MNRTASIAALFALAVGGLLAYAQESVWPFIIGALACVLVAMIASWPEDVRRARALLREAETTQPLPAQPEPDGEEWRLG